MIHDYRPQWVACAACHLLRPPEKISKERCNDGCMKMDTMTFQCGCGFLYWYLRPAGSIADPPDFVTRKAEHWERCPLTKDHRRAQKQAVVRGAMRLAREEIARVKKEDALACRPAKAKKSRRKIGP